MRRQSLRALARSRGLDGADVWNDSLPLWDGCAWDDYGDAVIEIKAPTRRAAEAGLRAALEAMPVKERKR